MGELTLTQTEIIILLGFIGLFALLTSVAIINIVKSPDLADKERKSRILAIAIGEAFLIGIVVLVMLWSDF